MNATRTDSDTLVKDNSTKIVQLSVSNAQIADQNKSLITGADRTEQYLRVNNVEIVGLTAATPESSDETNVLNFFNEILEVNISTDDIDICHEIPSKRRDKKLVIICKFISRKSKLLVLSAKSQLREYNQDRKADDTILLYEHLSPSNRELYIRAAKLKYDLGYKFLWTKNGFPFLRKSEGTQVFKIKSADDLSKII